MRFVCGVRRVRRFCRSRQNRLWFVRAFVVPAAFLVLSCSSEPDDIVGDPDADRRPDVRLSDGGGDAPRVDGSACRANENVCDGECKAEGPAACGSSCAVCKQPADATATCTEGTCSFSCNPGYIACGNGCCPRARDLSAGFEHTCAITPTGGVKCWGRNSYGQLGNGSTSTTPVTAPVDVTGIANAVAIAGGGSHTCALTNAGGVKCWGDNSWGQLGNDDTSVTKSPTPVDVKGLNTGIVAVVSGGQHSCAVTTNGAVRCWGINNLSQLGNISYSAGVSAVPREVSNINGGVSAIGAGEHHTCIVVGPTLACWGSNLIGELGNPNAGTKSAAAVEVTALEGRATGAVSGGELFTCARGLDLAVRCWGINASGQLGDNTAQDSPTARTVTGFNGGVRKASLLASGLQHSCAVTLEGGVFCWGLNDNGQLGDSSTLARSAPVAVQALGTGVIGVAAGHSHSCARLANGSVHCWGANANGQLGNQSTEDSSVPVAVKGF